MKFLSSCPRRHVLFALALGVVILPQSGFGANVVQANTGFADIFTKILTNEIMLKNKNITISTPGQQFTGEVAGMSGSLVELKSPSGLTQIVSFADIQAVSGEFGQ
jgi:hypothetical protein